MTTAPSTTTSSAPPALSPLLGSVLDELLAEVQAVLAELPENKIEARRAIRGALGIDPGPLQLQTIVRIAHEARYPAVGIFERDLHDYLDGGGDLHKIAELLEDLGLSLSEVMAFRGWVTPERVARGQLVERNAWVLRACEILECNLVTAPASGADIEMERYVENFRVACEAAAEYPIPLHPRLYGGQSKEDCFC